MNTTPSPEPDNAAQTPRLSRRVVLQWFAVAGAAMQLPWATNALMAATTETAAAPAAHGYGTDPDVSGYYKPGDFWPLTLTAAQRKTVVALADVILPADHLGPAASELKVVDYLDEWVSAPYPAQQKDRAVFLPFLVWLETESMKRFNHAFTELSDAQKAAICDDICWPADAKKEFQQAANGFVRFRSLATGAYYGTEAGWKAIGYVGNVPLTQFDGPPPEVLEKLGVTQTVK